MSRSSDSTAMEKFPDVPYDMPDISPKGTTMSMHNLDTNPGTSASAPLEVPRGRTGSHRSSHVKITTPQQSGESNPHASPISPTSPLSPFRRRMTRSNTFRTVEDFDEFENEPGWKPGAEPGVDPSKPDGGQETRPTLHAECQITVVDFSQDNLEVHELDNRELIDFVQKPQPDWVKCRWINVNGLSWDVIQALGKYKGLHSLAIEDIMNTKNRTKADWYANHAFILLTCQKLVRIVEDDSSDNESSDDEKSVRRESKGLGGWFYRQSGHISGHMAKGETMLESGAMQMPRPIRRFTHQPTNLSNVFNPNTLRTLQRFHASPNSARTEYMEKNSALVSRGVAVTAEQVAMFITSDNTVIAFFEQSADDVEKPILSRLASPTTILRKSCDASMVMQAIIDAIIDMAIPVTSCYRDVIEDLELDFFISPKVTDTKFLYIVISEVSKLYSLINPIQSLVSALRDHKTKLSPEATARELQNPSGVVIISPMAYTYLGDVYDHCVLLTEGLNQIKELADHMINLTFNTISTNQNESMKQLTTATIIFLPLTFITGYFGQNFNQFDAIQGSVNQFWYIAIPVVAATILILMRDTIFAWLVRFRQRYHVNIIRKKKQQAKRARARAMTLKRARSQN
ncbi:uncharacterized protein F4812DRAFT_440226 [Daldinia caldariorum]|uniref:uncharacterized protein n=1 Tax=Daldinia caldariorum TaxID=326644 RepID=UPI002008889A|nr:uncharacterized protein F4812DRAFT_440226 [Daldinia caldariorum]KAI1465248.1 hypothetical protein F4812DRAFT_440226 [Daldinia caldariorum]